MIEKDLDKVLNYMKQYVENKYEHDSEPMLNWKDLKLILDEIERLKKREQECIDHYLVSCKYASEMESKYISANYVINELEKWLEEQHQFIIEIPAYTKKISIEHKTMEICYENVLDKLQELKGVISNE